MVTKTFNKCEKCGRKCIGFLCKGCYNKLKKEETKKLLDAAEIVYSQTQKEE